MPNSINPLLEDDPIITIYLGDEDFVMHKQYVAALAKYIGRDIGVGTGFVNLYTRDQKIAATAVRWLTANGFGIDEVAQ